MGSLGLCPLEISPLDLPQATLPPAQVCLLSASEVSPGGGRGTLAYQPQSLPASALYPWDPERWLPRGAPQPLSASPTSTAVQLPWALRLGQGAAACRRVALTSPHSLGEAFHSGPRSASQPSLEDTQDTMPQIPVVVLPFWLLPPSPQFPACAGGGRQDISLFPVSPWAGTSSPKDIDSTCT